jgi:hypothetical protein
VCVCMCVRVCVVQLRVCVCVSGSICGREHRIRVSGSLCQHRIRRSICSDPACGGGGSLCQLVCKKKQPGPQKKRQKRE